MVSFHHAPAWRHRPMIRGHQRTPRRRVCSRSDPHTPTQSRRVTAHTPDEAGRSRIFIQIVLIIIVLAIAPVMRAESEPSAGHRAAARGAHLCTSLVCGGVFGPRAGRWGLRGGPHGQAVAGGDQLAAMLSAVRLASQGYLASSAITPIAPVICAWQAGVSLPPTAR